MVSVEAADFRSRDLDSEPVSPENRKVVETTGGRHLPERGTCDIVAMCLGAVESRCSHTVAAVRRRHLGQEHLDVLLAPPALGLGSKNELATFP